MPRPLKVYRWSGFHPDSPSHHRQCRFAIVTTSKGKARELAGKHAVPGNYMGLADVGIVDDRGMEPHVLYWAPLDPPSSCCPTCGGSGRIRAEREWTPAFAEVTTDDQ